MKRKKAAGKDGIPNEAWLHSGDMIIGVIAQTTGKKWKGERLPEEWRCGIIKPIYRKEIKTE